MIEIGKLNTLTVVRKSDLGYMLTDGTDEILMHFKESKKELTLEEKQAIEIEKLKRELEREKMVVQVLKKNLEIRQKMEQDSRLLGKKTNTKR